MMWHLFFLLTQWRLVLPPRKKAIGHREPKIRLKRFLASDWRNVHEEFFLQTQALVTSSSSRPLAQHDLLTHKHLLHSLVLGCGRKYSRTASVLTPFSPTFTSFDTTLVFTSPHLKSNNFFPFFLEDYELNEDLKLSSNSFK